jgi:hypothetical protein
MKTLAGAELKIVSLGPTLYPYTDRVAFPPRVFQHVAAGGVSLDLILTPDEADELGRALGIGATAARAAPPRTASMLDPTLAPPAGANGGTVPAPAPAPPASGQSPRKKSGRLRHRASPRPCGRIATTPPASGTSIPTRWGAASSRRRCRPSTRRPCRRRHRRRPS